MNLRTQVLQRATHLFDTRRHMRAASLGLASTLLALAACGGGSSEATSNQTNATVLGDNTATAVALAGETRRALGASQAVAGVPLPGARQLLSAVLNGASVVACPFGGSFSHSLPLLPLPHTPYELNFQRCEWLDQQAYQGRYTVQYGAFTSLDSLRWTGSFNLSFNAPGLALRTVVGTHECAVSSGTISCQINDGERHFGGSFSYTGDRINGSYAWRMSDGTELSLDYAQWTNTGGRVAVRGPGGFEATVVRTGPDSFTVTIKGGSPHSVTLSD